MTDTPLTASERQVWAAAKRLGEIALAAVARDIEAATGLSGADYGILSRLVDLGDGTLTQAALLASLGWEKSRLSHQLARMEARALLARDRRDGRAAVHILADGRTQIARARPAHAAAVRRRLLRHLSTEQGELLVALVERVDDAPYERQPAAQ